MADLEKITKKRLGELLVAEGTITQDQLQETLKAQERTGEMVGELLVKAGYTTETEIAKTLCTQFAKPFIKPSRYDISKEVISLLPPKLMVEQELVPIDRFGNLLVIAMAGLIDAQTLQQIQKLTSSDVEIYITTASDVKQVLRKLFPDLFDPITLLPKFEMTAELTGAVRPVLAAPTGAPPASAPGAPPDPRPAPQKLVLPSGPASSEIPLTEQDWDSLFEEAEQQVMKQLRPEDSHPSEGAGPAGQPAKGAAKGKGKK